MKPSRSTKHRPHLKKAGAPRKKAPTGGLPKGRAVVGLHAVREALRVRPEAISQIWMIQDWPKNEDLRQIKDTLSQADLYFHEVGERQLNQLAFSHQGIAAFVTEDPLWDPKWLESEEPCLLMALDQVSDPHNLGAVLRTAWLMGAKALFIPDRRSSPLTPAACKVASGGAEHVPVVGLEPFAQELSIYKDKGFWVYGLEMAGSTPLWDTRFPEKVLLVVGSEDKGLRASTRKSCDDLVRIFQTDAGASYNASVAAALVMNEVRRQHQNP